MVDAGLIQTLIDALAAYTQRYGVPDSAVRLQGIIGSLVSTQVRRAGLPLTPQAAEALVQEVASGVDVNRLSEQIVATSRQRLAEAAHGWRQSLESAVFKTINAYIQKFAPGQSVDALQELVVSVLPLLDKGPITKSEVVDLVSRVASIFNLDKALSAKISSPYLQLAQDLAVSLSQKPMEAAVQETVAAYLQTFDPTVELVSENLIETALQAILHNQIQFDWDTELNLKDKRLLIKQVSFKLNIVQASPPSSKTAQDIAAQIHTEVERFKQERAQRLGAVDVTTGLTAPDGLSVSSGWEVQQPSDPV